MKRFHLFITTFFLATVFGVVNADMTTNKAKVDPAVTQSMKDFKICDVQTLATQLSKDYSVIYIPDDLANYNYYMVKNSSELNADRIRKAVCEYIAENKCYLFWGNVANMAMIAQTKAPWFPADTSPHYVISPNITCKDLLKSETKKK